MSRARLSEETFTQVFGTLYVGLAVNALLVLTCLPCVALLVLTDPRSTWPLVAATAWLAGPALAGAFSVFVRFSEENSTDVVRGFLGGWVRHARRAGAVAALATTALVVLAVDVAAVWGTRAGAAAIPVFAGLLVLVVVTTLQALVGVVSLPDARVVGVLKAAVWLVVRRWHLTVVTIAALAFQAAFFAAQPVLALGLTSAPVLYLVWAGATYSLDTVVERPPARRRVADRSAVQPVHAHF